MIPASHDVLSIQFKLFEQQVYQIGCVKEVVVFFPKVSLVTCGYACNDHANSFGRAIFYEASEGLVRYGLDLVRVKLADYGRLVKVRF